MTRKARTARRGRAAELEAEGEGEDGEGEESSISLAAMEAQLKPGMLAIFDAVADAHKKIAQGPGAAHHGAGQGRRAAARDRAALREMQG